MTKKEKMEALQTFGFGSSTSHAIGGGEWSLEVYGEAGEYLFELVGSNGTRDNEEADDLNGELSELIKEAGI
jgi:hypothetical protein